MREFLLLIILFFGFSNAAGNAKYFGTTETFRSPILASYYGDYLGFKPGIHLGIERPVLVFRYQKDSTGAEFPDIERSFLTSYNLTAPISCSMLSTVSVPSDSSASSSATSSFNCVIPANSSSNSFLSSPMQIQKIFFLFPPRRRRG